ncbi:MAG: TlyA family RNA methyltransferase [Oscillibacter sp.]|nr:TlyA family RNA methyltransferase [Oscillibacter sp.]
MKKRLDVRMLEEGLEESRQKAQAVILAGLVTVNGQRVDKPGAQIPEGAEIVVRQTLCPYVSRGGLKLEKAMVSFPVRLSGAVCADIGASTGGFTDCMLQNGAAKVYAVDVGYGQLAWKLRTDARVVCLERTNARYLSREQIPEPLDFVSVDVSFISLRLILPPVRRLLRNDESRVVCLVKPQFEAGREKVGKKGVVRDRGVHREVLERFLVNAAGSGFAVNGLTWSPIRGPEGNIEYLGFLRPAPEGGIPPHTIDPDDIPALVDASHETPDGRRE